MMTRKDYVVTAEILNEYLDESSDVVQAIAKEFADYFADDNPKFDRVRFMQAVGV
jgi:hypothetical protein